MNITIQRISGPNPHSCGAYPEVYSLDTPFEMIEGEDVYFKVTTVAEDGSYDKSSIRYINFDKYAYTYEKVPYVIHLYKKATKTDISLVIDGATVEPDEDGIYRVTTNVDVASMNISAIATNNLDVKATKIDTESNAKIEKATTGKLSKNVVFNLSELDKLDKTEEKVITLTLNVQPEDSNIEAKEYVIEITRQDTSVEIKQVIGNGEDVAVDKQMSHYNYVDKVQVDDSIYTAYINEDVTEVSTGIIAESVEASIYLNEDYENIAGVGKVEGINVEIAETGITELLVRVVSEDGETYKDYKIWYIRKSDDVSIKELYVDEELIPAREDGNYEIKLSDTIKSINVKMIPNYQFANVSINGQPFKWQEVEEKIDEYTLKGENVDIKLQVNIPAEQSTTGEAINNTKHLYIRRVSTSNKIAEITTDNFKDGITPASSPQWNETTEQFDTYNVNIDGEREFVDLKIVPVSLGATLTLYDSFGNLLVEPTVGTVALESIALNGEDIVTIKVNVAPEEGEAKDYYINIAPKSSQAELETINVNNNFIELIEGVYDYPVYDLTLPEIGFIQAIAKDENSQVNIYTKEHPDGIGDILGSNIVGDVNFEQAIVVQITVMSPNGKNQNTYKLHFKDVSEDSSLQEVSYNTTGNEEDKVIVEMTESTDPNYAGEYVIELDSKVEKINLKMIATDINARIKAEDLESKTVNWLELSKELNEFNNDIVFDIIVTAESEDQSIYKAIIKKPTKITGKVVTENHEGNYENVPVQILDSTGAEVATTKTSADGTFEVDVSVGEGYKVVIKKPGYLTYTVTDIPVVYGVKTYIGIANLIAGEVAGNDEHIELRDMVQVNKKARANTTIIDDTNSIYDLNEDGKIDNTDLSILLANYDKNAENHSTFKYARYINVKGIVIGRTGQVVPNATIELGNKANTNEEGNFDIGDIKVENYTLTVKDSDGNIIGQNNISIVEGNEYKVSSNTITITPNTDVVDLQVTVNGTRAILSKRGEEPDEDMIYPDVIVDEEAIEITADKNIKVTVEGKDKNLASFELYTEDGTLVASKKVSGVESSTVTLEGAIATEFNTTHNLKVVVKDSVGNVTETPITVTDNVIRSEDDLIKFSSIVNANSKADRKTYENEIVTLEKDLDLTGKAFIPIGTAGLKVFKGTFDGKGHTISNINISSNANNAGLFGYVQNATIKNVGIESGNISSTGDSVGGIVGRALGDTIIENCYNKASINGNSYVGGIVGLSDNTIKVENCYNTGSITGNSKVGGIVGSFYKGKINGCYNVGAILGTNYVGEIVGYQKIEKNNYGEVVIGEVTKCYYTNGEGKKGIGGITEGEVEDTTEAITDIDTLLTNLGEAFKADVDGINNNYPVLAWEEQEVAVMKLSKKVASEYILPINTDYTITSEYDVREHPVTGEANVMHYGIDIAADWKSDVLSIADGTVTFAGENGGYGYCIEIEHVINGEKVYSFYAHLFEINVAVGDTVTQGQTIGLLGGMPGTDGAGTSTGPHLHLEIRKQSGSYSSAVDPRNYLEF